MLRTSTAGLLWDNARVEPAPDDVRAMLGRILDSPQFANTERQRRFLRYVVEQTLEGRADELKEFVVAVAVFDRDQSYDPRLDAVVRVEAGRLRTRLAEYYAGPGADDDVRIQVPKGGYVPVFERRRVPPPPIEEPGRINLVPPDAPAEPSGLAAAGPAVTPRTRRTVLAASLAVAVLAAVGLLARTPIASWRQPMAVPAFRLLVVPLDGDTDADGRGVTGELSRVLVSAGDIGVVAHSRVREAAARGEGAGQLARTFDVDYTVEGRVDARADTLMAELVLVDARAARKLWVQVFTGAASERAALLARAATAIASSARAHHASR